MRFAEARQLLRDEREAERSLSVGVAARRVFIAPHRAPPAMEETHVCLIHTLAAPLG